jgi:hypothetical protein
MESANHRLKKQKVQVVGIDIGAENNVELILEVMPERPVWSLTI